MTEPSNLIFFIADNHNRAYAGCYGHAVAQTPTIDRIAATGVRFKNAYAASAVCCPARAALATGRFPHQTGYWDNSLVYDSAVPSWHRRLREQGHTVTSIGKLHFLEDGRDYGFTESIIPMHIVESRGALFGLLRATPEGERSRPSPRLQYSRTGVGDTDYVDYDRDITKHTIEWLTDHAKAQDKPWVLFVSYAAPHPPFVVPQRLMDLYPPERMPLPPQFRPEEQPHHPAVDHIRHLHQFDGLASEEFVRNTVAGYCALITHTDEQIGAVMKAAEDLGVLETTRVLYTSDHGEAAGHHGLFAKSILYEHSMGVPLVMAGPGMTSGRVVEQLVSHVDLFPTIVESAGAQMAPEDADLMGVSLWPAIDGNESDRPCFFEYHGHGSKSGAYGLRQGRYKLLYYVGMPTQLFDLEADPGETNDLTQTAEGRTRAAAMEAALRDILDPEAVDARAKADQQAQIERMGGVDACLGAGNYLNNPVPGKPPELFGFGADGDGAARAD